MYADRTLRSLEWVAGGGGGGGVLFWQIGMSSACCKHRTVQALHLSLKLLHNGLQTCLVSQDRLQLPLIHALVHHTADHSDFKHHRQAADTSNPMLLHSC